jgi:hypothetical protein
LADAVLSEVSNIMNREEFVGRVEFSVSVGIMPWYDPAEYVHEVIGKAFDVSDSGDELEAGEITLKLVSATEATNREIRLLDVCDADSGTLEAIYSTLFDATEQLVEELDIEPSWNDLIFIDDLNIDPKYAGTSLRVQLIETSLATFGPNAIVVAVEDSLALTIEDWHPRSHPEHRPLRRWQESTRHRRAGSAAAARRCRPDPPGQGGWSPLGRPGKEGPEGLFRGVWAPAATIEKIRAELEVERSTEGYAKRREADARRRDKAQAGYVEDFYEAVLAFLAFHPNHADMAEKLARAVADHATPVGSGTVARTKRIPVERRAEAAVIAWMRHQTTAYETMKIPRVRGKRREVRRMLAQRSQELLGRYRGARWSGKNVRSGGRCDDHHGRITEFPGRFIHSLLHPPVPTWPRQNYGCGVGFLVHVARPNRLDGFFLAESLRHRFASGVGVVPVLVAHRCVQNSAAGHLEEAVSVVLPHPIPCVLEPLISIRFVLVGEPRYLIVAPDPAATDVRLPRPVADIPVVKFDQIWQVLTSPTTWRNAALASPVNAVHGSHLQHTLLRTFRHFHDS